MGPKCQNGPKKVPILPPSPKLLTLPSDAAEKRRQVTVSHCCALFRHTQCIIFMYFILSGPLIPTDQLEEGGHFDRDHNHPKDISLKVLLIRLLLLFLDEIYKYVIDDKMGLTTVVSQE